MRDDLLVVHEQRPVLRQLARLVPRVSEADAVVVDVGNGPDECTHVLDDPSVLTPPLP